MNRNSLREIALSVIMSLVIAGAAYFVDLWLFSSDRRISPADASFLEGMSLIILGSLIFLGSGGINRATQKAALLAATGEAVFSESPVGATEMFRRDKWKPKGYKAGLILVLAGIILLSIYFASFYIAQEESLAMFIQKP